MAPDFLYSALLSYRALWVHQPFCTGLLVCADFIWVLILAAVQAFNSVSVGVYLKGCSPFCTWRLKLDFSTRHVCFRSTPKCHNTVGGHRGSLMMKIIAYVFSPPKRQGPSPPESTAKGNTKLKMLKILMWNIMVRHWPIKKKNAKRKASKQVPHYLVMCSLWVSFNFTSSVFNKLLLNMRHRYFYNS